MSQLEPQVLPGHIFEEYAVLNLDDLSRMCVVERRRIVDLVEEGILRVIDTAAPDWRFDGANLRRARVALRLERDLEINLAGVALALELMDELEQLRGQLRQYR
jgi:chaperone modulatory protein CbpM